MHPHICLLRVAPHKFLLYLLLLSCLRTLLPLHKFHLMKLHRICRYLVLLLGYKQCTSRIPQVCALHNLLMDCIHRCNYANGRFHYNAIRFRMGEVIKCRILIHILHTLIFENRLRFHQNSFLFAYARCRLHIFFYARRSLLK